MPENNKRLNQSRVFINDLESSFYLFKLTQVKDGSIILSSPKLSSVVFQTLIVQPKDKLELVSLGGLDNGHISFHGRGKVHVTTGEQHLLPNVGQYLLKPRENEVSARHLFTATFSQPDNPVTVAGERSSDCIISANPLKPFALLAFAMPANVKELDFQSSFNIDDLDEAPGVLGIGDVPFRHHNVIWIAYRTKHMESWPKVTTILYHDGIVVPFIMSQKDGQTAIDFRNPEYQFDGSKLSLSVVSQL